MVFCNIAYSIVNMSKKDKNISNTILNKKANKVSTLEKYGLKIAITLLVIAIILRCYNIGYLALWVDEYMHAFAAMKGKFTHGENNGILLTWINTSLAFIFGFSETALRTPVAIIGSFIVLIVYKLGKEMVNTKVGLISAIFTLFSIYLIFWSRVDRPYGIVPAFYCLALLYAWLTFEKPNLTSKLSFNKKYLFIAIGAFILAMLSQLISFLLVFSIGFYATFLAINNLITKKESLLKFSFIKIVFYLNIVLILFMFTPLSSIVTKPILEIFLPKNIATFILPDFKNIATIWNGEQWDKCYNTYKGVLNTDFKNLAIFGWLGFILSFFYHRKVCYFLVSSFVVPFLLLSFIFTSTSHAKYLIQIYPIFLLSAAYTFYFLFFIASKYLNKNFNENNQSYTNITNAIIIIILIAFIPFKSILELIKSEKYGNLVAPELSEISYVNWKQPCLFLKDNMKKNDIVMATVQTAPKYYLEMDSVVWFRQMQLNPKWSLANDKEEKYIPNKPENRKNSAYTYEQLVKTYENNPRGWLLADYYFENALTDPKAKEFVEKNFIFHFEACTDGAVKVFSWDKAKPKTMPTEFVIELGKNEYQQASQEFSYNINTQGFPPKVSLFFVAQGIDTNNEAYILINGKPTAIQTNGKPNELGTCGAVVDASFFKNGENKIQFAYNPEAEDSPKGFVIMNMSFQ